VRSVGATPGGDGLQMPWFEDCRFNIPEGKSGQVVGAIIGAIFWAAGADSRILESACICILRRARLSHRQVF